MDYNQFIARQNGLRRESLEREGGLSGRGRIDNRHRFSEPKTRINLIKINKNKLPVDFFLKKESHSRRTINLRSQQQPQELYGYKKAQSERLHVSPQKTSFFGFFEEEQIPSSLRVNGNGKLYTRKFETREEPKRDAFLLDSARKLTTATKNGKNQLLELFPPTYDQQITDIIISSSKTRNLKLSPRKQISSRLRDPQPLADPEKQSPLKQRQLEYKGGSPVRPSNVSMSEGNSVDSMNLTFFNSKSTSFPPIHRVYQ